MPDRGLVSRTEEPDLGTLAADHPAGLVTPVVPTPPHSEEALVPDDLGYDLEADPLQTLCHFGGVDSGVPDVADCEGGHQSEGLGPVDPRVAADRGVAMATLAPTGATGRRCRVISVGLAIDPHVRPLGGTQGVVHAVTPGSVVADPVWRIGREQLGFRAVAQARHGLGIGGVTAGEPMVAQDPEITRLRARGASGLFECLVEIEALDLLALLADFERAQQILDLVLAEARQRQVDVGAGLQVGQQTGEESVIPGARDPIEREVQEACLLYR